MIAQYSNHKAEVLVLYYPHVESRSDWLPLKLRRLLENRSLRMLSKTRMHSSRMSTAHGSSRPRGGLPKWMLGYTTSPTQVWAWRPPLQSMLGYHLQGMLGYHHPLCEQNDRRVQKYYLAPNFVCGR